MFGFVTAVQGNETSKHEEKRHGNEEDHEAEGGVGQGEAAPEGAIGAKARRKTTETKPKKPGVLDGAVKVLGETGKPMSTREMVEEMAAKGYWKSPAGKTPSATLYSAILRELKTKGAEARFKKTDRGRFALANAE